MSFTIGAARAANIIAIDAIISYDVLGFIYNWQARLSYKSNEAWIGLHDSEVV